MAIVLDTVWPEWWLDWPWHERCALLMGERSEEDVIVRRIVPVSNRHHDRRNHFAVSMSAVREATMRCERWGWQVVGVVHTHPITDVIDPSADDIAGLPEGWVGAVLQLGDARWYTKKGPVPEGTDPSLAAR
jgi:proteasome lid subunit RPN8/RPN11